MSQEEFDREFTELKEILNIIMELLQEIHEYERWDWILQIYISKLRRSLKHRLGAWNRKEELKEDEYRNSLEIRLEVHFCEPKKGIMLGDENEIQRE
jgi:hypothetical protein